jgi:phosphatidylglycerol---prolipoprotein diacylglyceryl transferase
MLTYPDLNPVALAIGPVKVHWYGLMYLVGFLAAWWLGRRRAAQPGSTWSPTDVDDLIFDAMLGVVIGGRIGYLVFYGHARVAEDWHYIWRIWEGGMSFHGGLIGVIVALVWFSRRRGRRVVDVLDFMAPLPAIGLGTGRIGNFINGELWGKPTDAPWGFLVQTPAGPQVLHASQLYEAVLEGAVLFAILWVYTSRPRPRWAPSGLFLLGYGVFRFVIEFVRVPDAQLGYLAFGWFTMGQLLTLPMIVLGLWMLAHAHRRGEPSGNRVP